jgi:hypothetical protein
VRRGVQRPDALQQALRHGVVGEEGVAVHQVELAVSRRGQAAHHTGTSGRGIQTEQRIQPLFHLVT